MNRPQAAATQSTPTGTTGTVQPRQTRTASSPAKGRAGLSADLRYDPPKEQGLAVELEYRVDATAGEEPAFTLSDDWTVGRSMPWAIAAIALAAIAVVWLFATRRTVRP